MQVSLLDAATALDALCDSWPQLQQCCGSPLNSNTVAIAADTLNSPDNDLQLLICHDGDPAREIHALCIVEQQRAWTRHRRALANWIASAGLDSSPLISAEQRYSALTTLLQELPSLSTAKQLRLRHLGPKDPNFIALQAICSQQKRPINISPERRGSLRELTIELQLSPRQAQLQRTPITFGALRGSAQHSDPQSRLPMRKSG